MADIAYKCPKCDAQRMVSEFAAADRIMCGQCAVNMVKAELLQNATSAALSKTDSKDPSGANQTESPPPAASTKPNKLKLARATPEPLPEEPGPPAKIKSKNIIPPEETRKPLDLHPKKSQKKKLVSQSLLAFLLFTVVGCLAYVLRYGFLEYGNFIPEDLMSKLTPWSWAGLLFLHVLIVLKAFTSDMMQGILCLFIPGWSFVYLILSDHFWHKAIIFGLLFAVGADGSQQLYEYAMTTLGAVQEFINSGGGDVR